MSVDAAERSVSLDATVRNNRKTIAFDGKPFFQGFRQVNGVRCKHYKFPPLDYHELGSDNIGKLSTNFINSYIHRREFMLKGEIDVPAAAIATYEPNDVILCHPNLLAGFRDGDYQNLHLVWLSDYLSAPSAAFPESFWQRPLDTLSLNERPFGPLDQSERVLAQAADHFQNISKLQIALELSAHGLAQLKCLKSIKHVRLAWIRSLNRCFQALEKSPNLSSIEIYTCQPNGEQFEDLPRLAGLKSLEIGNFGQDIISAAQLKNICKLRHLEQLTLPRCHYSRATVENLSSLKELKNYNFMLDTSWGTAQVDELRRSLSPGCKVTMHVANDADSNQDHDPLLP